MELGRTSWRIRNGCAHFWARLVRAKGGVFPARKFGEGFPFYTPCIGPGRPLRRQSHWYGVGRKEISLFDGVYSAQLLMHYVRNGGTAAV